MTQSEIVEKITLLIENGFERFIKEEAVEDEEGLLLVKVEKSKMLYKVYEELDKDKVFLVFLASDEEMANMYIEVLKLTIELSLGFREDRNVLLNSAVLLNLAKIIQDNYTKWKQDNLLN